MDKEIIKRFRDEVNAQDLVLQMYRNYAGKNYWNIICSIQLVNINDFKVCLGHLIDFGNIESIEELYVCVKAGFFYLNSKGYP